MKLLVTPLGKRVSSYARLRIPRSEIPKEIDGRRHIRWSKPMTASPKIEDQRLYCTFHKNIRNDIDNCSHLKDDIERLVCNKELTRFTVKVGCYKNDRTNEGMGGTSEVCYQNHQFQRTELERISEGQVVDKGKSLK